MENWGNIKWYENYQVSTLWNVKNISRNKNLKLLKSKDWYLYVFLCNKWIAKKYRIHRLVANTFLWNKLEFTWNNLVCHKNDIRHDNRLNNLFLWTYKDNAKDCALKWRSSNPSKWKFWKDHNRSKKVNQYSLEWKFIKTWLSLIDIERELNIKYQSIWQVCNWNRKTAWWYMWKFI